MNLFSTTVECPVTVGGVHFICHVYTDDSRQAFEHDDGSPCLGAVLLDMEGEHALACADTFVRHHEHEIVEALRSQGLLPMEDTDDDD